MVNSKKKRNWFCSRDAFPRVFQDNDRFLVGFFKTVAGFSGQWHVFQDGGRFLRGSQHKPSTGLTPARVSEPLLFNILLESIEIISLYMRVLFVFCLNFGNNKHRNTSSSE